MAKESTTLGPGLLAGLLVLAAPCKAQEAGAAELLGLLRAPTLAERAAGARKLAQAEEAIWIQVVRSLVRSGEAFEARIQDLVDRLGDERWEAREQAQRELVRMGPSALPALEEASRSDALLERRWRATQALVQIEKASPDLMGRWERERVQLCASAWALGVSPPADPARRKEAADALVAATGARDRELARIAVRSLARLGDPRAKPGLQGLVGSGTPFQVLQGLGGLERLGDTEALEEIASQGQGSLLALAAWAAQLRLGGTVSVYRGPAELAPLVGSLPVVPVGKPEGSWRALLGSGEAVEGRIHGLTPEELVLELPGGQLLPLPMSDLARAELLGRQPDPGGRPAAEETSEAVLDWVLLATGSWLPGKVLERGETGVRLDLTSLGERTLAQSALVGSGRGARPGLEAGLAGSENSGPGLNDPLQPFLVPTLQLIGGGELKGFLLRGDRAGILLLEPLLGALLISLDRISALTFRTGLGVGFNLTLIADYENNEIFKVDDLGRRVWQLQGLDGPWDARWLPSGTVLVCEQGGGVREFTADGKQVWEYAKVSIPYSAQRLASGNTLIADTGNRRVVEVSPAGEVVWEYGPVEAFDAERLPGGNTLMAEPARNRVFEVSPAGEIVWEVGGLMGALDADRLPGGNTLVTCRDDHSVVEIDPRGKEVWKLTGLQTPNDADRLPGGLTLVAESGQVRLFDLSGRVVWKVAAGWAGEANRY